MQSTARLNADCQGIVMECFGFLDYDNMHKACRCDQSADGVRSSIMMAPDPTSCEGPCVVLILLTFDFEQCSLSPHFIFLFRYV